MYIYLYNTLYTGNWSCLDKFLRVGCLISKVYFPKKISIIKISLDIFNKF